MTQHICKALLMTVISSVWLTNTACVLKADSLHLQFTACLHSCWATCCCCREEILWRSWRCWVITPSLSAATNWDCECVTLLSADHTPCCFAISWFEHFISISFGKTQKSKKLLRCFGPLSDSVGCEAGWVIQSNALQLAAVKGFLTGRELDCVGLAQSIINIIWTTSTVLMIISVTCLQT